MAKNLRTVTKAALKILNLEDIQVDSSYQRDVKKKHAKIISEFDPDALGIPVVGERADGSMWIVDGLQRITALKKMGRKEVRAEVFASDGPEHEARVFKLINLGRTRLTAFEEYKALLAAHDRDAWAVKEAVEGFGYKIASGRGRSGEGDDYIPGVSTLMSLQIRHGTGAIRFALKQIKECWPGDKNALHHSLIMGLGLFWARYEGAVEEDRLQPRLKSVTPQRILFTASQSIAKNKGESVTDVIEKVYRKRLGTKPGGNRG